MMLKCRHCLIRGSRPSQRGLCNKCYANQHIRYQYPAHTFGRGKDAVVKPGECVHRALVASYDSHPLWVPSIYPVAHTVSHPHLPRLSDAELDRELRDSKAELEDEVGTPCRHLAYPYGEEDDRVRSAARRAGYDAAFAVDPGRGPTDRFAVPRLAVYRHDTMVGFRLRTSPLLRRLG